ncbi:uncharacterized protein NDAI_0B00830 [Naumovozyma dairenensis CBS 421]|uniref:Alpha/beta hydrolase fold-3 domain-containing protein n=1 Tax=Naumovozyma dairenensis (strain ATCC 10597 / BCRC 20456 / CBS 421 / NBRC 0211 / NRRL Y-12639) TaxID=1071378 RepID=G0W5Q6_NAUDC|nr:hypothetical protein NDAI_0B00830 [Naumovozyma dairenensis CBS 421]CCD23117.1 hypothetical protein NDAI_0B00830 [Naumovozyma dairenensis CBS 421]
MHLKSLLFIVNICTILPIRLLYCYLVILIKYKRSLRGTICTRTFMRESFILTSDDAFAEVINPLLNWCVSYLCGKPETLQYCTTTEDRLIFDKELGLTEIDTIIDVKYRWFKMPDGFDPRNDDILIYFHGGGYAVAMSPSTLTFLGNLSKKFPKLAIIMLDYSLTLGPDSKKFPAQLLEGLGIYDYVINTLHCENVILMGESSGGNLELALLNYLITNTTIPLPKKAVLISPWANPSKMDRYNKRQEKELEMLDCVTFDGSIDFKDRLLGPELRNECLPLVDILYHFDPKVWYKILDVCSIYVTYGKDEILRPQIEHLIDKFADTHPDKFNEITDVSGYEGGCHIEPLLVSDKNMDSWSQHGAVSGILQFIEK